MQTKVSDIVIRNRVRKNLGDLAPLMESLRVHGLMNPVVINSRNELIAGHRRTEAARKLGWETIETRIIDTEDDAERVALEIDENTQRKDLTTDELAEAYLKLDRLRNPSAMRRLWSSIRRFFRWIGSLFRRPRRRRPKDRR